MTKKIFFLFCSLFIGFNAMAQGVDFRHISLDEALAASAAEGKPVFLDCYTEWCGPCKHMTENVFPQKEVGDFFNEHFVSLKIDMEKSEGPAIAERYGIKAYPTFLILDAEGNVLHKIVGGGDAEKIIAAARAGLNPETASVTLQKRYDQGERSREFLLAYANLLNEQNDPQAESIAQEIFESLEEDERILPEYWVLFESVTFAPRGSEIHTYFMANAERFRETIGREKVDAKIYMSYMPMLTNIISGQDSLTTAADVRLMAGEIEKYGIEKEENLLKYIDFAQAIFDGKSDVTIYKELSDGFTPEEVPYTALLIRLYANLTPESKEEWKAWGAEIIELSEQPFLKAVIQMVIDNI